MAPIAALSVCQALRRLGSTAPAVRLNQLAKAGPIKTDQGFVIVDAPFAPLLTASDVAAGADGSGRDGRWEAGALARAIVAIPGVLEVGLFVAADKQLESSLGETHSQQPVAVYFGQPDGQVRVRTRDGPKSA